MEDKEKQIEELKNHIKELEKENFKLAVDNGKLKTENQQLKDRIAELEKEIEENAFYSKGYAQGIKNTYEVVIPEKLKQFAERLKEHPTMKIYSLHNACERIPKAIDETLKEYENDTIW